MAVMDKDNYTLLKDELLLLQSTVNP